MTPVYVLKGTYRWNNTLTRIPINNPIGLDFESTIVDGATTTKFTFNRLQNSGDYIQFYVTKVNNSTEDSRVDTFINVYNLSTNRWEWELQDFTVIYPMTYDETLGNWFNNNATAISVEPEPEEPEEPDEPDTPTETKTIKKGTYRFNDIVETPSEGFGFDIPFTSSFLNEGVTYNIVCNRIHTMTDANGGIVMFNIIEMSPLMDGLPIPLDAGVYNSNKWMMEVQIITVTEDATVDDTSSTWFNTNTKPYTETPDTPDTDPTVDSLIAKLQNLINKANTVTGKNNTDITSSVCSLIAGYGRGGGGECDRNHIIEVDTLPTENISEDDIYKMGDSYYQYRNVFKDVLINIGSVVSLVETYQQQGATIELFSVDKYEDVTDPHPSNLDTGALAIYYDASRDDIFFYASGAWYSISLELDMSNGGAIADASEATTPYCYYALVDSGWKPLGAAEYTGEVVIE
jgi:hypothetical protein